MNDGTEASAIVNAVIAAWDARDLDRLMAYFAPDVYWHDLGMVHPPAVGLQEVRRFTESVLRAFPDFRIALCHSICVAPDGSRCVVPWTITATNTGPLEPPGMAPTGRRVNFSGFDYVEFRGQLIARIETRFDPAEVIEQLTGLRLRPAAGSWAERLLVLAQRCLAAWVRRRARVPSGVAAA
jgi:predicted ester cyclase